MFASLASPRAPALSPLPAKTLFFGMFATACLISLLYLGDVLTPVLVVFQSSLVMTPVVWIVMALPTLCVMTGLYLLITRFAGFRPWVAAVTAAMPFVLQAVIIAPLSEHRVMSPAYRDGGQLPNFAPTDVLAVMDMPGRLGRASGVCGPTCVHILQATSVNALFLPRTYISELSEASGVIYRIAPRGKPCETTVTMARRAPVCLTTTPARLSQATHILSLSALADANTSNTAVGRTGGLQIRLTGVGHTAPVYQQTGMTGRTFARLPLIGDPVLTGAQPHIAPRFLTRDVAKPMPTVSLIEWYAHQSIRRPRH